MNSSSELRKTFETKNLVKVGGAFDALSAKLVEINQFDAIWAGSFAISATHALPDASILTMTEFLHTSSSMVDACSIPVIADCDTGFGGPSNVSHLVKKYESSGIAAICIEDKIFPKQNSLLENGTQDLLSEKDFVAKIIAGKNAKQNDNFMIIARTEALIAGTGVKEALKRAQAYEIAGADAILIHSKKNSPDEIFEFCDLWNGAIPLVVVPTTYPGVSNQELIEHKIKMVIYANQTLRAAYIAMSNLLSQLNKANSIKEINQPMTSMNEIFDIQKMFHMKNQEKNIEEKLKKLGYST